MSSDRGDRPNVLWICTDQQRWDTLGCYGNEHVSTETIDSLADGGALFERAYCQNPVCTPSRASFLTGRYPRTTRCRMNGQPFPMAESKRLLPRRLSRDGYYCGLAGKLHLSPTNPDDNRPPSVAEPARRPHDGYAVFDWSPSPRDDTPANRYQAWLRDQGVAYESKPIEDGSAVSTSMPVEYHQTPWLCDRTVDFVEQAVDRAEPWLFSLNIFDPHPAFDPPREYLEPYLDRLEDLPATNYEPGELDDKPDYQTNQHEGRSGLAYPDERERRLRTAAYYAMVDLIDDSLERVLAALERTGQRENTIVVFQSDHGELLGDHGMYLKGPFCYEGSVRVPLIIDGPGVDSARYDELVELVDLAPTLATATGLDPLDEVQGRSMWPALTGEGSYLGRDSVYCEQYDGYPGAASPDGRPTPEDYVGPDEHVTMLRTDSHKVVVAHHAGTGELYDLEDDPMETHNRWDDPAYAEVKADLLARLTDRMVETVDPAPEPVGSW
ncbi:sulfatase family protein [Halomontanus rarus]|uniref:sulfatase family protein n=1 Tax=Halomontanus rarus TaxID=3034020 RepID=UPI0023E8EE8A|nr:sulfatase-like hydrolase/transferase [Halovivax sp. TS33]